MTDKAETVEDTFEHIDKSEADDFILADLSEDETGSIVNVEIQTDSVPQDLKGHASIANGLIAPTQSQDPMIRESPEEIIRELYIYLSIIIVSVKTARRISPNAELDVLRQASHHLYMHVSQLRSLALLNPSLITRGHGSSNEISSSLLKVLRDCQSSVRILQYAANGPVDDHVLSKLPPHLLDEASALKKNANTSCKDMTPTGQIGQDHQDWIGHANRLFELSHTLENCIASLVCTVGSKKHDLMPFKYNVENFSPGERYALSNLRRNLYKLKDTTNSLYEAIAELQITSHTDPVSIIASVRPDVEDVNDALVNYLSNCKAEWLEAEIEGKFSFTDFRSLDLHYLINVEKSLDDWQEKIAAEARLQQIRRDCTTSWSSNPEILNEEAVMKLLVNVDYVMDILTELKKRLKI